MLITVFGRRGSGKTTLIKRIIPKLKKPVIILDILGNYDNEAYDVTSDVTEGLLSLREYLDPESDHPGVIVVMGSDISRAADFFSSALWKTGGGTLVLDEIDAISLVEAPCFDEAVRYGRNRGIDIITGCRRPAEISKNITAGADLAYCLTTHEPRDIQYYREFLGDELAFKLPNLPQHHGVWRDFKSQKSGVFKTTPQGDVILLKSAKKPVQPELDFNAVPDTGEPADPTEPDQAAIDNPKGLKQSDDNAHKSGKRGKPPLER